MTFLAERLADLRRHLDHLEEMTPVRRFVQIAARLDAEDDDGGDATDDPEDRARP